MNASPGERGTILVLEDDPGIRILQRSQLERAGYSVKLAASLSEARQHLQTGTPDLLLLDYQLGASENGLAFYRELQAAGLDVPAILVTGFSDEARLLEAMRAGVRDFIPKTPNFVDLVAPTVDRVMEQVRRGRRLLEAEAAGRAKDDFLATLSHELRTPLTPVVALVAAMRKDERLPEDVRADLETINRNVLLEARLIDDLLDLTRISRGKLELRLESVDLRPVVLHAVQTVCDADGAQKKISCHIELSDRVHQVRIDPARITQVFWNLLKNAVKFTPPDGEIRVTSRIEEEGPNGTVIVEVRDNGIGIEPEALPRIFGAFEQGGRGITRRFGGLGLGLAITKAIVGLHGGSITAASEGSGRGATFTVRLPLCAVVSEPTVSPAAPARSASGQCLDDVPVATHILVVEDHPDTAHVLARMLRRHGYQISLAGSVGEALKIAEESTPPAGSGSAHGLKLVVSDLGLPDGSGIDLMSELRSRHQLRGIALSGFGMDEDVRRALSAGFSRHLTKPVDIESLLGAIREMLQP